MYILKYRFSYTLNRISVLISLFTLSYAYNCI